MRVTPEQREAWAQSTARSPFNLWLDALVRDEHGQLDLAKLHAVARRYGVEREAQYRHLNPGQQRMNIGNMLRRLVPESDLLGNEHGPSQDGGEIVGRHPIIRLAAVLDLLRMHAQIMDELRDRQVVRTGNAPLGDYAELLFATAFGWALTGNSASGYDATDPGGVRYQIKGRRVTARNPSRQLSAMRRLPERTFDVLAGAIFDESYCVVRAVLLPHELVASAAKWVAHTNSWRFLLEDKVWQIEGARDVTADLKQAAELI